MASSLTYNVSLGVSLLEWESIRQTLEVPAAEKSLFTYSDTLFPVFAFLTGFRPLSPKQSLYTMGLGVAHNALVRRPITSLGSLQSIGIAALLLHTLQASEIAPLVGVASSYIVLKLIAAHLNPPSLVGTTSSCSKPGREPDLIRKHDIQDSMGIATTAATMWMGQCITRRYLTTNELFVTGVSLISFGHLSSYAFANKRPAKAAYWSHSYALIATGLSLINYIATNLGCRMLMHYGIGVPLLRVLGTVGSHPVELYFLSALLDISQIPRWLRDRFAGLKGRIVSALVTNAVLIGTALLLENFKIHIRIHALYP